ncbi:chemotaxis protein CheD [Aeribacillus pallidus]|uniref:chemotaxis protein CheD n=1 Tax=Aeribacillus pallidus TaxID=33936 RepID=UPI003D1F8A0F
MNSVIEVVKVGIADLNVVRSPNSIRTSGLGSCVGVVIYDQVAEVGGLAHIMLPDSSLAKGGHVNKAKFADTAIPLLYEKVLYAGASKFRLKAKMAGGAQMFQMTIQSEMMRIGPRNVEAVRHQLERLNIPIVAEDVGGNSGRTVEFFPQTGVFQIRTVNKGTTEI